VTCGKCRIEAAHSPNNLAIPSNYNNGPFHWFELHPTKLLQEIQFRASIRYSNCDVVPLIVIWPVYAGCVASLITGWVFVLISIAFFKVIDIGGCDVVHSKPPANDTPVGCQLFLVLFPRYKCHITYHSIHFNVSR